ncbi:histidine kinase, partial [Georgenia sp. 10Sc9-8]|nr:histidine kinase [Georgenia halotolerans]
LSVVIAQADGGRYAARSDPAAAERALTTISETGRSALADMRRILGVLRGSGTLDHAGERLPQPVDADLDSLVAQVRSSGLAVSVVRSGTARPLPPGVGLSVYRIVQEALTNVLKHAGPAARATVTLGWTPTSVVLQVEDDGRGAAATDDGAGQGLVGMRERVALFGGWLDTGPRPGGGFRVRAAIPVAPNDASVASPDGRPDPYAHPAPQGDA